MDYNDVEILFAEDSADDARQTIRALKKSGLTNNLHHVSDGAEALDFIFCKGVYALRSAEVLPKLILLDLKMPKVSGIQVLEKIKSDPAIKKVPVVILTSSREDPDIAKCYDLGANSYIVKPVDSDNFLQSVKNVGMYWMVVNQSS
jgi:CheY-like chemotaxis protein